MHLLMDQIYKAMTHNVIMHVYSNPTFSMEVCISLLMCFVHCLLILDVNRFIRQVNVPHVKIRAQSSLKDVTSRGSIYKQIVRNHPDLGVDVVFTENALLGNQWNTVAKINAALSTSLSETMRNSFQKMQRHLRNESAEEIDGVSHENKNCSELYSNHMMRALSETGGLEDAEALAKHGSVDKFYEYLCKKSKFDGDACMMEALEFGDGKSDGKKRKMESVPE